VISLAVMAAAARAIAHSRTMRRATVAMRPEDWPGWAKKLRLHRLDGERGLGDTAARVIGPVGGEAFKRWWRIIMRCDCGCAEGQVRLNAKFPYTTEGKVLWNNHLQKTEKS